MNRKLFRRTVFFTLATFAVIATGFFCAKYYTSLGDGLFQADGTNSSGFVNVMILGLDKDETRTDTIMMAQYDRSAKSVKIIQIPRDTKIDTKRSDKKINSAFIQGKETELYNAINTIFGIKVDKYVQINTNAFRQIIDEIGGVKYDVPINMDYDDPTQNLHIHLKKGEQVLDGEKAEEFVRFREGNNGGGYPDGDLGRMKAQRDFIMVVVDKALSVGNIAKVPTYYKIFKDNVKTNLSAQQVTSLLTELLTIDKSNISFFDTPGTPKYINEISYVIVDTQAAHTLAQENFNVSTTGSTAKPTSTSK